MRAELSLEFGLTEALQRIDSWKTSKLDDSVCESAKQAERRQPLRDAFDDGHDARVLLELVTHAETL
jgi:hypothetical protein